jgi:TRAP-type C4-dicarboxylate transport system permease small subunit
MAVLERLLNYLLDQGFRVSKLASIVAGLMILIMAFVITIDITARKFLSWTLKGADEFAGYTLAIAGALALTHALFHKKHIRIDSLLRPLDRWPVLRAVMDILALVALAVFIIPLTLLAGRVFWDSWNYGSKANTIIEVPMIYPQSLWLFGFIFFSVIIVALLLRSGIALLQRDLKTVNELIGVRSEVKASAEEQAFTASPEPKSTPTSQSGT